MSRRGMLSERSQSQEVTHPIYSQKDKTVVMETGIMIFIEFGDGLSMSYKEGRRELVGGDKLLISLRWRSNVSMHAALKIHRIFILPKKFSFLCDYLKNINQNYNNPTTKTETVQT